MPRTVGSIESETLVTIPVKQSWVMQAKRRQYVFMAHIQPRIRDISNEGGSRRMYDNFNRAVRNRLYNTVSIYGLDAVDIEQPQNVMVSVRLKIVIVPDDSKASCSSRKIEKPAT